MFQVEFYTYSNGKEPIKELIIQLQKKGHTSNIETDLWELRPLDDRIFFFYFQNNTFILLHHFVKKTKRTPKREIQQAKRNLSDYLERTE